MANKFYVVRKANPTGPVYVGWPDDPNRLGTNVKMINFTVNDGRVPGRTTCISEKEFCEIFERTDRR